MLMILALAAIAILAAIQPQLSCRGIPTGERPQTGLPVVTMQLGGKAFTLEIAGTEQARQTGLMYRDSMPADHGMIFVFAGHEETGFWMKNTRIPLDIIYIDDNQRIVSIHQMVAHDTRSVYADGPYKWAIELNDGTAAKLKLKPGQQLDIPQAALQVSD
ncbi:MAG: DUF192 domain-containing protein [Tepidisphaeraceae bacterium]